MNMNADEMQKKYFSVEDVVSYLNIELTNANDNKAPAKVVVAKVVVWVLVAALTAALFLI
jgi:hypothetical protein